MQIHYIFEYHLPEIHWTGITSSPNFIKKKSWDLYTIRSVGISNDCMLNLTF